MRSISVLIKHVEDAVHVVGIQNVMWWNIANVSTTCIRSYFSAEDQRGKFVILQV
jgi:hypothetical protein